ncbi:hypothetical protein C0W42_19705 [Photobacterium kishitanii]|uniref:hypothetical protein n=1 Tax=Photobacterium kishitanii TaxID=318456 RepID=UPI000D15AAE4|nr:hypothetical protein [Photobacterium kishitanii]PSU86714.1 hypothetical protein C0W42_19705 [Photobacterium kishitanii]
MKKLIAELNLLFKKRYSFKQDLDDEITNKVDEILYFINSLDINSYRVELTNLSHALHNIGSKCVPYLILLYHKKYQAAIYKPTFEMEKFTYVEYDQDEVMTFINQSMDKYEGKGFSISEFNIPSLDERCSREIYSCVREIFIEIFSTPLNESDHTFHSIIMALSRRLSAQLKCQDEFYIQFGAYSEKLNLEGKYQLARDFAEEILICSDLDNMTAYGQFSRFSIYTAQQNAIDSLLNGCSLLTTIINSNTICSLLKRSMMIQTIKMYRELCMFDLGIQAYDELIHTFNLESYERQKTDMIMFYLKLMQGDKSVVEKSNSYVRVNINEILAHKNGSLIPWLSFISNVKANWSQLYKNAESLMLLENEIKNELPESDFNEIQSRILRGNKDSKESLRTSLVKLSDTRNCADYVHETNQLIVTANRVIENSVGLDVEGILLGHQIKSDGSISFNTQFALNPDMQVARTFDINPDKPSRFNDYLAYVLSELDKKPKNINFIWMGFVDDKLFSVVHNGNKFQYFDYVKCCSKKDIDYFVNNVIPSLAFDDTPKTPNIFVTREDLWREETEEIENKIPNISLPISDGEIVIFSDVAFSKYPHNLIKINNKVRSTLQPISSPLSLDNYVNNNANTINIENINVWAPVKEQDYAIQMAYSKLKVDIEEFNCDFYEDLVPIFHQDSDVNIFISHGGRDGSSGFNGVFPSDGKVFLSNDIFGTGKVALLFICHSGSIVDNMFSNSCHTLVKSLLEQGYETVIAPSWSLNVCIPGVWTKALLNKLNEGVFLSQAVFYANKEVSNEYPPQSAWAAMHLFGNPHLKRA